MKFKDFLNESKVVTYHGDDFGTKKLEAKLMNNGNNQEGIGIYFGSLTTAETYGKYVVKAEINHSKFIDSREDIGKYIKVDKIAKLFVHLHKLDGEPLYYMVTDWGIDGVVEPEDVEPQHLKELASKMLEEEVRNFQITLAEAFGVVDFVEAWNKIIKIPGTYQKQGGDEFWYAIIDTKIKVEKI